jgi:hypothetical protein
MRKRWWWPREDEQKPSPPPPPPEPEISLPDPDEARKALAESKENARRLDEFAGEVKEMLAAMKSAREENNFAEGIVEMIRRGR